ncbi:MAG: hypothetical protein FWG99_01980 [Treponema sp.]|nr:hypothetical protein [Treponema sp.]
MSYSSKRTIVSMTIGILSFTAYLIYALSGKAPAPEALKSWATAMLVFIGISVAVQIVVQILFHIGLAIGITIKEKEHDDKKVERIMSVTMLEDEREKLISLKSAKFGYICAGFGFIAALVTLVLGMSTLFALHIMGGSFAAGSLAEGSASVYFNEKGI